MQYREGSITGLQAGPPTAHTGVSGAVQGLPEAVKKAVSEGLSARTGRSSKSSEVRLIDQGIESWSFPEKELFARMAVAIGCSDEEKPALKHLAKMDPAIKLKQGIERY